MWSVLEHSALLLKKTKLCSEIVELSLFTLRNKTSYVASFAILLPSSLRQEFDSGLVKSYADKCHAHEQSQSSLFKDSACASETSAQYLKSLIKCFSDASTGFQRVAGSPD